MLDFLKIEYALQVLKDEDDTIENLLTEEEQIELLKYYLLQERVNAGRHELMEENIVLKQMIEKLLRVIEIDCRGE